MAGQVVETPQLDPSGYYTNLNTSSDVTLSGVRALWVGGAGIVKTLGLDGVAGDFTCGAGTRLDISPSKVLSTSNGTTATLIVALK